MASELLSEQLHGCLSLFWLLSQSTTEQQTFGSHSFGGWTLRPGYQHGRFWWGPSFRLQTSSWLFKSPKEGERAPVSFIRAQIPHMRAPPSSPIYLPKDPPPNTNTLGVRIPTYDFWGDTNIQSIAMAIANIKHNSCNSLKQRNGK